MTYAVKDIFLTLQGEGVHIGKTAVFVRFAGCNLWSGREQDRAIAICRFCDTDFVGGERISTADDLVQRVIALWPQGGGSRFVVLTGGEPLLQVDGDLLDTLHEAEFVVAVETNATCALPGKVDWVCASPKAGTKLALTQAHELKVVFPQPGLHPSQFSEFRTMHRWLSPMYGPSLSENIKSAAAYCLTHPEWRLAIQAHKVWGLP